MFKIFRLLLLLISILLFVVIAFRRFLADLIARSLNRVRTAPPYRVRAATKNLHEQLFVADLHADPLLWRRDLLQHASYGHIDLPRLVEGRVALQVFAAATKIPASINFQRNPARGDLLLPLAMLQGWPPQTWFSQLQRAIYQAQKLRAAAAKAPDRLFLIADGPGLEAFLSRREQAPHLVGALLALEGVHALEGDLANLALLYQAGFRIIGLAHFFDNEAGGSAHGWRKGGLTPFGRSVVQWVEENRLFLDLAHASPRVIDDVLNRGSSMPLIVSHTGVQGICDNPRNISDEHVRGVAATGGLIGIALFKATVCGTTLAATARSMRYVADLVGVDHVALGSDYDGAILAPVDASGLPLLSEALRDQGFDAGQVAKIMGGNFLRVLRQAWLDP